LVLKGCKIQRISLVLADGILRRLSPSLTTVSQHGVEMGVADYFTLESEEENKPYQTVVIKTI
jgi:LacI family transcriptional regulator